MRLLCRSISWSKDSFGKHSSCRSVINFAHSTAFSLEVNKEEFFAMSRFQAACRKALATPLPPWDSWKFTSENKIDSTVPQIVGIKSKGLEINPLNIFHVKLNVRFRRVLKIFFTPKFNQFRRLGYSCLVFCFFLFSFPFLFRICCWVMM